MRKKEKREREGKRGIEREREREGGKVREREGDSFARIRSALFEFFLTITNLSTHNKINFFNTDQVKN